LPNKEIDLVLDNRYLNIFDNIGKDIDFFIIILLEYLESIIFFLEFSFRISIKVRINNKALDNTSLSRSFY
jgi:hypothetical protein